MVPNRGAYAPPGVNRGKLGVQVRTQGGGGVQGVWPPLLCHDVGFLTLGPKLALVWPPFFACRPNLNPPFKNPGSAPGVRNLRTQCRGGCRNSLRGGGVWARILRMGGLESRSVGIFIY